jgi:hypothetical protein
MKFLMQLEQREPKPLYQRHQIFRNKRKTAFIAIKHVATTLRSNASIYGVIHRNQALHKTRGKLLGRAWRILNNVGKEKKKKNKVNDADKKTSRATFRVA